MGGGGLPSQLVPDTDAPEQSGGTENCKIFEYDFSYNYLSSLKMTVRSFIN